LPKNSRWGFETGYAGTSPARTVFGIDVVDFSPFAQRVIVIRFSCVSRD
jgi:hypothetical protein